MIVCHSVVTLARDSEECGYGDLQKARPLLAAGPDPDIGYSLQTKTFDTRVAAEMWAHAIEVEMDWGYLISRTEV